MLRCALFDTYWSDTSDLLQNRALDHNRNTEVDYFADNDANANEGHFGGPHPGQPGFVRGRRGTQLSLPICRPRHHGGDQFQHTRHHHLGVLLELEPDANLDPALSGS